MEQARAFLPKNEVEFVVHHSPCDDGHGAAALFWNDNPNVILHGIHPKDNLLTPSFCENITGKCVVFVDIAFSVEITTKVAELAKKVVILDHHDTNQSCLESLVLPNLRSVFVMGRAGVDLAWEFLKGSTIGMPSSLYYIGLKDVWKHKDCPDALYFTTAFVRPSKWEDWRGYIDDTLTQGVVDQGKVVYNYQRSVLRVMMQKVEYIQWRDFRVAIVNVPYPWISDIGDLMCEFCPEQTFAVIWNKSVTGDFSVSLRSNDNVGPDVGKIALEFGGGGHVHAAALRTNVLPWILFK